ncbi:MAG: glycosyltransferase family 2 protein [Kiritimatiellaeota bacterium]|nr:glycosyltransferase family 2 protein [Kiritimatiellota bacterium]
MRYSVIILTHNNIARTQRCLMDILRLTDCRDHELILVDNGSTDGTAVWQASDFATECKARGVPLTLIRNAGNIGCSPARNQGIDAARGACCVFLDNDVSPLTTRWLQGLEAALVDGVGMVGPKMVYPSAGRRIQCAGVGISWRGNVAFLGRGEPRDAPRFNQPREVQALISACMMVPRGILLKHGGFDSAFHPVQFEDFDLCYRLRGLGFRALYEPSVEMLHYESSTTQGVAGSRNAATVVRNGLLFKKRWRHVFETEDGPPEEECRWRVLPPEVVECGDSSPLS